MSNKKFFNFLYQYTRPYFFKYSLILVAMLYTGIHISFEPYLLKLIIDKVVNYQGVKDGLLWAVTPNILYFILASIFFSCCWQVKHILERAIIPHIETSMAMHLFQHLQLHSHRYFQEQMAGTLSNKIADLHAGVDRILGILTHFFRIIIAIIVTIILMYTVHAIFASFIFFWSVLFLMFSTFLVFKLESYSIKRASTRSIAFGRIVDTLTNIMTIKLFARHEYEIERQNETFKKYITEDKQLRYQQIITWVFLGLFATTLLSGMVTLLVYGTQKSWVSIGDFSFIMLTSVSIIENMFYLMELIGEFIARWGTAKQGAEIIQNPPEIKDKVDAIPLKITRGAIQFKDVHFSYSKKDFFASQNIKIFGGQKVGLVGYSGGGKTTFVNLICRLYDIQKGTITIDDQDITNVTQSSLHEAISYIPQDPILFHRTLFENISYGKLNAKKEEIITASKLAHAHHFITHLPEGYNTMVGERGMRLSGGQRQRIAIARAYLKNAPILIMDEATSALDSSTERYIQESMEQLMENKTVIIIAHRLSTLMSMDRILVFEKGRIIEDGDHKALLDRKGLYYNLWQTQTNGFISGRKRRS